MSTSDPNSPFNDPSYSRERLELETRVLAAALRQSLEIGDTEGSSLAHEQIFLLLKASQEMVIDEPINLPREVFIDRGRQLPDIDWGGGEERSAAQPAAPGSLEQAEPQTQFQAPSEDQEANFAPPVEAHGPGAKATAAPLVAGSEVTTIPDLDSLDSVSGLMVETEETSVAAPDHVQASEQPVAESFEAEPATTAAEADQQPVEAQPVDMAAAVDQSMLAQPDYQSDNGETQEIAVVLKTRTAIRARSAEAQSTGSVPPPAASGAPVVDNRAASAEETGAGEAIEAVSREAIAAVPAQATGTEPADATAALPAEVADMVPADRADAVPDQATAAVSEEVNGALPAAATGAEPAAVAVSVPESAGGAEPLDIFPELLAPNTAHVQAETPLTESALQAAFEAVSNVSVEPIASAAKADAATGGGQGAAAAAAVSLARGGPRAPGRPSVPIVDTEPDYYVRLGVNDLADFHSIHLAFWIRMRQLLKEDAALSGIDRVYHLRRIQRMWIAHDILCDPVTRADYDFRKMGVRGADKEEDRARPGRGSGPRTQLRIGELLQCAGLLEQSELDVAADMHKAMPEIMFGTFLVKHGFVDQSDLDCVLVGQQLLKQGDITVVQFQTVMIERSATGLDIGEMLLAKGYVTQVMLESAYRNQSEDTLVKVPAVLQPGSAPTQEAAEKPSEPRADTSAPGDQAARASEQSPWAAPPGGANSGLRAEQSLNISNAAPSWKDQLDWNAPEGGSENSGTPGSPPGTVPYKPSPTIASAVSRTVQGANAMNDALAASVKAIAEIWSDQPTDANPWVAEPPDGENPFLEEVEKEPLPDDPNFELQPIQTPSPFITPDPESEQASAAKWAAPQAAAADADNDPSVITGANMRGLSSTHTYDSLDVVSEIETSGQLPSLGELELKAKMKEEYRQGDSRTISADQQAEALQDSARSNAFIDDSQPGSAGGSLQTKEVTGGMAPLPEDYAPSSARAADDRPSGRDAAGQSAERDGPEAAPDAVPSAELESTADGTVDPAKEGMPGGESRRARRRRSRH